MIVSVKRQPVSWRLLSCFRNYFERVYLMFVGMYTFYFNGSNNLDTIFLLGFLADWKIILQICWNNSVIQFRMLRNFEAIFHLLGGNQEKKYKTNKIVTLRPLVRVDPYTWTGRGALSPNKVKSPFSACEGCGVGAGTTWKMQLKDFL